MKTSRRSVIKSLSLLSLIPLGGSVLASSLINQKNTEVVIAGNKNLSRKYLDYLNTREIKSSQILKITEEGLPYVSFVDHNDWREKLKTATRIESGKDRLIILVGCRHPELVLQDTFANASEIWVDRPLHLSNVELLELSRKHSVKINIVQIDRDQVFIKKII